VRTVSQSERMVCTPNGLHKMLCRPFVQTIWGDAHTTQRTRTGGDGMDGVHTGIYLYMPVHTNHPSHLVRYSCSTYQVPRTPIWYAQQGRPVQTIPCTTHLVCTPRPACADRPTWTGSSDGPEPLNLEGIVLVCTPALTCADHPSWRG
jgi:hypothetical protein